MNLHKPLTLWLATQNAGKIAEFNDLLRDLPLQLRSMRELNLNLPKEGTAPEGATLESNARLKAEAICAATQQWALADDSGLFVEALPGALGVDTALYGGPLVLLNAMKNIRTARRKATFKCVVALARPNLATLLFDGAIHGRIAAAQRGQGGFGYDAVFIAAGEHLTTAERVDKEGLKAKHHDHRGQAVAAFKAYLKSII